VYNEAHWICVCKEYLGAASQAMGIMEGCKVNARETSSRTTRGSRVGERPSAHSVLAGVKFEVSVWGGAANA
jgi:hypothetical protein